jgi:hypothetical protein
MMDLLYYIPPCLIIAFLILVCTLDDLKWSRQEIARPHEEPAEPTPELDPEVYAYVLASLLIDAEIAGLEQVIRNPVQRRGDDESGKGAKI